MVPVVLRINVKIIDLIKATEFQPMDVRTYQEILNASRVKELMFQVPSDGMDLHTEITLFVNRRDGHYDALYHESNFSPDPSKPCILPELLNSDLTFIEFMDFI